MIPGAHKIYEFGPFRLEIRDRLLIRSGKAVPLTPKAFDVLVCLLDRRGHLVEKDDLMREVWPDSFVEEGNVSRTVWALRRALAKGRNGHSYIETIPKHGYRFVADVSVTEPQIFIPGGTDAKLAVEPDSLNPAGHPSVGAGSLAASASEKDKFLKLPRNRRRSSLLIAGIAIFVLGASGVGFFGVSKWVGSSASIVNSNTEKPVYPSSDQVKPEAMDAYMDGLNAYNSARNMSGAGRKELFLKAIDSLDRAISLQPDFIDAQSMLVQSYTYLAMLTGKSEDWTNVEELGNRILLNSENAAALSALATVEHRYHWDWAKAEAGYLKAIEVGPNSVDGGHAGYALLLSGEGRHDEAIAMMKRAIEIDPNSNTMKVNLGNIYMRAKQYDKALDQLNKVAEWHPDSSNLHATRGQLFAIQGNYSEAIAETKKSIELSKGSFWQEPRLAWVYAKAGQRKLANMLLAEFMKNNSTGAMSRAMFDAAGAYAELGENDKAYALLERLYSARAMYLIWLKVEPPFERLQGDRRYVDLLRRVGLK